MENRTTAILLISSLPLTLLMVPFLFSESLRGWTDVFTTYTLSIEGFYIATAFLLISTICSFIFSTMLLLKADSGWEYWLAKTYLLLVFGLGALFIIGYTIMYVRTTSHGVKEILYFVAIFMILVYGTIIVWSCERNSETWIKISLMILVGILICIPLGFLLMGIIEYIVEGNLWLPPSYSLD